ncbi:hypothetical protein MTR_1g057430 [Medicago truncatula]|uniref:Uncharacterized protein n=1 Tax=Medicago truncatula TaxID=3880 RepID=A0A072VJG3_MEDTR|nr:hypothetical protein MTR_1g057430 [Medicago truncatula]
MGSKWDIEKFIGDNNFGLWKVKMEAVLIQQKCEKALKDEGVLLVTVSRAEKTEMVGKARSAIVLCLKNKVLREVAKETTAMVESKAIMEKLTEFNKIIDDLDNIKLHLEDAGALMVWCCLEGEECDVSHLENDA